MAGTLPHILFVCTGNAGRSQIAAALARRKFGKQLSISSAGVAPWPHLHSMTQPTLRRRSVELIGDEHPKPVSAVCDRCIDLVITIGDPARQKLPRELPGGPLWLHWDVSDPADADGTPDSEAAFERAACAIEKEMDRLPEMIATLTPGTDAALRRIRGLAP